MIDYAYDAAGNVTQILYPTDGDAGPVVGVQYVYDDNGRVDTVKRKLSTGVEGVSTSTWQECAVFEYAGGREIERVQTPYDLTRTQTWTDWREPDVLQYLETSTSTLLTGLDHSWNAHGYLTVRERMHDEDSYARGEVYRYDLMGRMT